MRVESTTETTGKYSQTQNSLAAATGYTSDDFMKMLLAQLSNQNPLDPMDDTEMMSQFTQLNSLQELQSIGSSMSQVMQNSQMGYAASLIGKAVTVSTSSGVVDQGNVTAFLISGQDVFVEVNGQGYSLDDIVLVQKETVNG